MQKSVQGDERKICIHKHLCVQTAQKHELITNFLLQFHHKTSLQKNSKKYRGEGSDSVKQKSTSVWNFAAGFLLRVLRICIIILKWIFARNLPCIRKEAPGEVPVGVRALNSYGNSEKFRKKKNSVDFERILQKKERMWWLRKYGIFATIERSGEILWKTTEITDMKKSAACADGRRTRRER